MNISDLKTPAFLIEHPRVAQNCKHMAQRAWDLGVRLRPHVKSHKTLEVARMQVETHFGGITVSTLAEARAFAKAGFRDITYAVPMSPDKLEEAVRLTASLDRLNLILDHPAVAEQVAVNGLRHGLIWPVFLKVDCGYHRAGVDPTSDSALELAKQLYQEPSIDFRGILTHAGHAYNAGNAREAARIAEQEVAVMVSFAKRLRAESVDCPEVSIGATPTCVHLKQAEGITEIRPGNYALFDQFQADIGSCHPGDIACSVLTTVIGNYPERDLLLLDAGALALGKDPGATHVQPDCGFGRIVDYPHLKLVNLSQEHCQVRGATTADFEALLPGDKLRIVPNHVCLTAALHATFLVVDGDRVMGSWKPVRGW